MLYTHLSLAQALELKALDEKSSWTSRLADTQQAAVVELNACVEEFKRETAGKTCRAVFLTLWNIVILCEFLYQTVLETSDLRIWNWHVFQWTLDLEMEKNSF